MRLVNQYYPYEGRVEIFINGEWGTICEDNIADETGIVICRVLGLPT